jgi:hypothetical protein
VLLQAVAFEESVSLAFAVGVAVAWGPGEHTEYVRKPLSFAFAFS